MGVLLFLSLAPSISTATNTPYPHLNTNKKGYPRRYNAIYQTPTWPLLLPRPRDEHLPLLPGPRPIQTPVVHHRAIRHHGRHAPAQPLAAHRAHVLLRDDDAPSCVPPPTWRTPSPSSRRASVATEAGLGEAGDDAHLVDDAAGAAHAAAEVGTPRSRTRSARDGGRGTRRRGGGSRAWRGGRGRGRG